MADRRETIRRGDRSETDKFTIFSNEHIQNHRLTWEARGLLHYLLSLPRDWRLFVDELEARSPAGSSKNRRILAELLSFGHLRRIVQRGENGQFESTIWEVWENPFGWEKAANE